MKILICDDMEDQYEKAKERIPDGHEVHGRFGEGLQCALGDLFSSIPRLSEAAGARERPPNAFDGYDVAIVDNDLSGLEVDGARLSAEAIIGYLRAFTNTPYVVSLNKNPTVDFDLRYLLGDYQSHADLAINTDHLQCERLWRTATEEDFAPWYWPCLPDAYERRRKQMKFVRDRLDEPIWQELGFPDLASEYLSRHGQGTLLTCGSDQAMQETTFRQFFDGTRTLLPRQKQALGEIADDGSPDALDVMSRVVAGDLDRWIRRDVLGPQDVLIDVPHLLARMPFLMGDRVSEVDHWNETTSDRKEPFGLDPHLYKRHVQETRFHSGIWVPSPCFWWPPLRGNRDLTEFFFSPGNWPDVVFCEDASAFRRMDDETEQPREIEVELEGSWPRRYIAEVDHRNYSPRSRLV